METIPKEVLIRIAELTKGESEGFSPILILWDLNNYFNVICKKYNFQIGNLFRENATYEDQLKIVENQIENLIDPARGWIKSSIAIDKMLDTSLKKIIENAPSWMKELEELK